MGGDRAIPDRLEGQTPIGVRPAPEVRDLLRCQAGFKLAEDNLPLTARINLAGAPRVVAEGRPLASPVRQGDSPG